MSEYDMNRGRGLDLPGAEPWVRAYERGGDRGGTISDRVVPAPSTEAFTERKLDSSGSTAEGPAARGVAQEVSEDPVLRLFDGLF